MAHKVCWVHHGRLIGCHYHSVVTIQDVHSTYEKARTLIQRGKFPTHLLVDHRCVERYDLSLKQTQNIVSQSIHENLGKVVVVIPNAMGRFFSSVVTHGMSYQLDMVDTMDDALAILCDADVSLPSRADLAEMYGEWRG